MVKRSRSQSEANSSQQPRTRVNGFRLATASIQQPSAVTSSRVITLKAYRRRARKNDRHRSTPASETPVEQQTPRENLPTDPQANLEDLDFDSLFVLEDEQLNSLPPDSVPKLKRMRDNTTSAKLIEWLSFRSSFLDELLRHDGRADYQQDTCASCEAKGTLFKCRDCFNGCRLRCQGCTVKEHQDHPLHRVEEWNGLHFVKTSLKNLGLRIQLGHVGGFCGCSASGPVDFCIVDITGLHSVAVDFCDCRQDGLVHRRTQILRAGWLPATFNRPQTAFTFDVLSTFHELTLQGKITAYDFYHSLARLSDNAELGIKYNRYKEFHRAVRLWRHLMMLKRAGRGQDPAGPGATSEGELAVECPACPHPGRNLPESWELSSLLFLYILYLAVDANFKLKGKDRGINDPELGPGWGSFVEESRYQKHLTNYVDQPEINTCQSEHDAIVRAAVRQTPGYSTTGSGLVICSRHCLVRPNGVGDLQKGEKYCNMDYIIFSSLIGVVLPRIVLSYDIMCQWSKNFRKRMDDYPESMKINSSTTVDVAIPTWHVNGHGDNCKNNFSLSYMVGAGRTCGEDVETSWAHTNALGPSVREMGPGARHETLNDHWNGWNFRKIVNFRPLFLKRFREAYAMRDKHRTIFHQFSSTFRDDTVKKWAKMVEEWNDDHSKPNPYAEPKSATTLHDVRLQLAREEASDMAAGIPPLHQTTLTSFLTMALDLEEQQRVLRQHITQLKGRLTSKQEADIQDRRTSLMRRIHRWREIQLTYVPCVGPILAVALCSANETDNVSVEPAERTPLHFPSSLPLHLRTTHDLDAILEKEKRLRLAQADDALAEIRRQRRIITGLWQFKKLNVAGMGNKPNTRMRSLYNRFNNKTLRCAERYRAAYAALLKLDPLGTWRERLQFLHAKDIRGPGKEDDDTSNGRFEPSWIWLVPRVETAPDMGDSEGQLDDSMRPEWAKSQARMQRWEEEVLIIIEEMRRVIAYCEWKASWWRARGGLRCVAGAGDVSILEGVEAYAHKQAAMSETLASQCALYWLPALWKQGITPEWGSQFTHPASQPVTIIEPDDAHHDPDEVDEVENVEECGTDTEDELTLDTYEFED